MISPARLAIAAKAASFTRPTPVVVQPLAIREGLMTRPLTVKDREAIIHAFQVKIGAITVDFPEGQGCATLDQYIAGLQAEHAKCTAEERAAFRNAVDASGSEIAVLTEARKDRDATAYTKGNRGAGFQCKASQTRVYFSRG